MELIGVTLLVACIVDGCRQRPRDYTARLIARLTERRTAR